MKCRWLVLVGVLMSAAAGHAMSPRLERSVRPALDEDVAVASQAWKRLRDYGPEGLEVLLRHRNSLLSSGEEIDPAEMARVERAIDAVGGAKYCSASGLFWHTDLEVAKLAAERDNKPILSLRMMGNLTDELSCANSRFFRTTLYANADISKFLRENFVLHWKSVRPVPKITIDFGDGRKLERTITGNSAHYVLLADGTVVDCLPGLYGPKAFREQLTALARVAGEAAGRTGDSRRQYLVSFHEAQETLIVQRWERDLERVSAGLPEVKPMLRTPPPATSGEAVVVSPPAQRAAVIAAPKARVELPAIRAIAGRVPALEEATTEEVWEKIAQLHREDARLDEASRTLIAAQNPTAAVAGRLAITKSITESPLVRMLRNLEQAVAMDTVRNEYELHRKLHRWFIEGSAASDVDALNERVYAELFLTPRSDPWLGLGPGDAYAALPDNGVVKAELK